MDSLSTALDMIMLYGLVLAVILIIRYLGDLRYNLEYLEHRIKELEEDRREGKHR